MGYFVISASAQDESTFSTLVDELIATGRTEGLMVINPYVDQRFTLLPQDFPLVFLGATAREGRADAVRLDDLNAGRTATQHLLDLGHTHIAMPYWSLLKKTVLVTAWQATSKHC